MTTLLSTIEAQEKPEGLDHSSGNNPPLVVVFNERGQGVAYIARKEGLLHIVHNGKAGRPVAAVDQMSISPDGKRIAYSSQIDGKWRMVIDEKVGVLSDEVNDPVFSPDSRHIAYQARIGEKWHMVVDDTLSPGCLSYLGKPFFSADSTKVLFVERAGKDQKTRLIVSDLSLRRQYFKKNNVTQFLTNEDKTTVAAVIEDTKKYKVITFSFTDPDTVTHGPVYDSISSPAFGTDSVSFSYVAEKAGKRYLILNDKEERLPEGDQMGQLVVRPDNEGVGVIMVSKDGAFLHEAFSRVGGKKERYDEAADLAYSKDSSMHAYAARKGNNWFLVVNGKVGPVFDRVVTPLFSPDGTLLIYRARKDGKRFVVVADAGGKTVRQHQAYEQVFPVTFTSDGKSVAYGVKDGKKLIWKVEKMGK